MKKIPVFYTPQMSVKEIQPSPSSRKPEILVNQWLERNYSIEIKEVLPVTREHFYMSHDKKHVDDILNLKKPNGMDTLSQELCDSLFYTSGSLLSAAKHALTNGVGVSPTSGFHHAEYDRSMGFCTFNGLTITAQSLLKEGLVESVGILDCDQHYGNGTKDIIEYFDLDSVYHITAQQNYIPLPDYDKDFFDSLPLFLQSLMHCDLLIYQAGADCHLDDPYGGFLSSEQMRSRDRIVFEFCKSHQIPLVWNLAGGYQEDILEDKTTSIQKVLDLHNATLEECAAVYL